MRYHEERWRDKGYKIWLTITIKFLNMYNEYA